ncbi:hypothetical protein VCSRO37_2082 [Vibrio cholerae]|nr:hypothetical protein VCSRO126_2411 [Vibrio cholerae]GIA22342.1 hypothetical protein VCSRO37_2082 [Vibrio cholerae]
MRLGELTYLTDQIVTFGFSSLELRNKAHSSAQKGLVNGYQIKASQLVFKLRW